MVNGRDAVMRRHRGDGPTLVLLHGAGGNHMSYDDLLVHLGNVDVVVPSLPGRCDSAGEPLATVAEMATWTGALLGVLGLRQVVVMGHSLGGAIALELALSRAAGRPELTGLILACTGARLRVLPAILAMMEQAAESGMPTEMGAQVFRSDTDPGMIDRALQVWGRTPASVALADWRAADAFDRMEGLGEVSVATVVLAGSEDQMTPPKYARYLAEHIPNARLELLEGAGHMLVAEEAGRVAELVRGIVRAEGAAQIAAT